MGAPPNHGRITRKGPGAAAEVCRVQVLGRTFKDAAECFPHFDAVPALRQGIRMQQGQHTSLSVLASGAATLCHLLVQYVRSSPASHHHARTAEAPWPTPHRLSLCLPLPLSASLCLPSLLSLSLACRHSRRRAHSICISKAVHAPRHRYECMAWQRTAACNHHKSHTPD